MATLDREIEAYETQKGELERHHLGKWVLIRDCRLVGAFDSFDTAAREAVRRYGRGPYLIRQAGQPAVALPASLMVAGLHADR